jgi:serine/threonine protein kinase/tetratricopeptide (TPR) repeat protein
MALDFCPTRDELRLFLDDQVDPLRHSTLESHIDDCAPCQSTLDDLTQEDAYDLPGRSTEFETMAKDPGAPPADRPDAASGVNHGTQDELGFQLDSESTLDQQGTRLFVSTGETRDSQRATDIAEDVAAGDDGPDPSGRPRARHPHLPAYDLLEILGEGGMGVVYKARQRGLNRFVAVKMIRGGDHARSDQKARFLTEAEAVAQLHHPNIVQIFDIGEAGDSPFVSLELLEGGSLGDRLASTPQPGRQVTELLITLARAVQVAHNAGIVHRDLKPSNILFSIDGIPKITDFGLAKRLESDSRQTESGQIMGSPSYMAPEQASGHTRNVGPAADVYALGAILYEMLTGRPPFKGETPIETVRMVIDTDPVPPSQLVPRVARDLETICLKCLVKEPHKRHTSAADLAADLARYANGEPIAARRTPFYERGFKWAKRHPFRAALAVVSALIIVGTPPALMILDRIQSAQIRERERIEFARVETARTDANKTILAAQKDIAEDRLNDAERKLVDVRTRLENEPKLRNVRDEADTLLTHVTNRIAGNDATARDRARFKEFHANWNETLFEETRNTSDLVTQYKAIEKSARAALAVFAQPDSRGDWVLAPLPGSLENFQREEIREGTYELLLVLSEVVDSTASAELDLESAARLRPPTPAFHMRRAARFSRAGETKRAAAELETANRLVPTAPLDHFLLGKEAYKAQDYLGAIKHFDLALETRPGHFASAFISGLCNMHLGRPDLAKADFRSCLQMEPEFAWLYLFRGYASYQAAQLARTVAANSGGGSKTLRSEIERSLKSAENDYARGFALLEKKPDPQLRYALLSDRGLLAFERHDWNSARSDFQAAIDLDGKQYATYASLANALLKQGKPDQAIEQFTRAIALGPDRPELYRGRADIDLARPDLAPSERARALSDLEHAIRLVKDGDPVRCRDQTNRATLFVRDGRDEEALAACEEALKVDSPYLLKAHQMRLELLLKLKRYDDLIRSCDAVISSGKATADQYYFRALAREHKRDYKAAIEDCTQAIALRKSSAPLLAKRAELYLITESFKLALREFEEVIKLDPASADAYAGMGMARVAMGEYTEAVADAAKALRMPEPTDKRLYNAARIYAKAAVAASADVRKNGLDAVAIVNRYQEQAIALIRQVVLNRPANQRASFFRDVVHTDPALQSLRRRLRSIDPAAPTQAAVE